MALARAPLVSGAQGANTEAERRLGPLRASQSNPEDDPSKDLTVLTILYLERVSPASDQKDALQLNSLPNSGSKNQQAGILSFLKHPLVADIIPKSVNVLSEEMGVLPLSRQSCSLRDAWALASWGRGVLPSNAPRGSEWRDLASRPLITCSRCCSVQRLWPHIFFAKGRVLPSYRTADTVDSVLPVDGFNHLVHLPRGPKQSTKGSLDSRDSKQQATVC
ncbi:unnamed protein product, partial [Durusdinium trenchii]